MKLASGRPALIAVVALIGFHGLIGCEDSTSSPSPPAAADDVGAAPATFRFEDVTATSGIDMVMTCGASPSREILEVNGGGIALIDYDNDEDFDVFIANGATMTDPEHGPGSRLFRNDGDLSFTDVTAEAGVDLDRWAMGATVGDYDADGYDDLYIACFGPNVLLRNTGDGRFEDRSAAAGVADGRWASSCVFGDLDGDADLDLYVVNYLAFDINLPPPRASHKGVSVMNGPHGLTPQHDVLYENLGDGTFDDVTVAAGCRPAVPAFGLNVVMLDFDRDGRQDILVGNDSMANFFFHNQGGMTFEEMGTAAGVASNFDGNQQATMGLAVADVDDNGFPDIFSTNFANDTNTLHLNLDGLWYDDRTRQYGLGLMSRPYLGWACGFYDFDHDADEDLLVFNGHVYPEATEETMDSPYEQTPLLYRRLPDRFEPVDAAEAGPWLAERHRDRAAAFGDLDRDGDIDVIVGELNGPVRILRNLVADEREDWLIIELSDDRPNVGNRRAAGSRVELQTDDRTQRRWIHTSTGFQSSSAPIAHFAVPDDASRTLIVYWVDGTTQRIEDPPLGSVLRVRHPDSAPE